MGCLRLGNSPIPYPFLCSRRNLGNCGSLLLPIMTKGKPEIMTAPLKEGREVRKDKNLEDRRAQKDRGVPKRQTKWYRQTEAHKKKRNTFDN